MSLSPSLMAIVARLSAGGRPEEIPPTTLPSEREEMLDLIAAAAARDPKIQQVARGLYAKLAERLGRAPTRPELLQWLMDSVHLLTDYVPDEAGKEVFQSVQWTLGGRCGTTISPLTGALKGCGDCEDQAALLVALCLALGIRARVKWLDQPGSPLNHVSAMALLDGGQWICTDATIPGARPGETPYQALDRVGPGFRSRIFGLENAAGGIFAPAGYPAPMRYRPAGTNAEVRVMNLMQLPRTSWQFMLDGAPVTPIWTTPEGTVLFRTTSGQHTFTIIDPLARSRTWNLTVHPGATALDWSAPDVAILIHDFPTSRMEVTLDGAPVGDRGGWADYSARIYRVLAPIGRHTLRIADASGAARVWTGDLDAGGLTRNYADIQPERRLVANLGSLRILNMIPSARVLVDDVDRTADGNWIAGAAPYTWGDLSLPAGAHTVSVLPRAPSDGPTVNARSITVNAGAQTTMETGWLPRAATPEATTARLVIVGMPAGGAVAVNGTNIPHERSLAMVPPPDVGAEGLNWPVPVAPGNVTVRVTPPAGQGPARTATLMVPATGAAVRFSAMTPEATGTPGTPPSRASEIEVSHIPPDSRLFVDGVDVSASGRWVDLASGTFSVPAAAGLRSLRVHPPTGVDRAATGLAVPAGGAFSVDYNTMAPVTSVTPDSSRPVTSIRVINAPASLSYALDGLDMTPDVRCVDLASRAVEVPALPGPHNLRLTTTSGAVRGVSGVQVPTSGFVAVDYNTMAPIDGSGVARSTGRVVVRGAPAGIFPARVLVPGGVSGDPAQSQPLTPQPEGYLAVTWPVGPARLQVGAFDVPVTVILAIDTVYDYSPAGLTFQPLVTDARLAPLAGQAQGAAGPDLAPVTVELRALPDEVEREVTLTSSAGVTFAMTSGQDVISEAARLPGAAAPPPRTEPDFWRANVPPGRYMVRATSLLGRVRTTTITTGPSSVSYRMDALLWTVSGQGAVVVSGIPHDRATGLDSAIGALLGNGSRYLAELAGAGGFAGDPIALRPLENGDLAGYVTPGAYTLTVYLESSNGRQAAVRSAVKRANVNVAADQLLTVAYADMPAAVGGSSPSDGTAARNAAAPVDANHTRLTVSGLADGWTVEVDGATAQPEEGLTRGAHTIVLTNPARGLSVSRQVVLAAPAETVDVSFDVARAAQFASGKDGVVNITEDGLRNGYPAQITSDANARIGWLTPTEERRIMREFDVVGAWRDADGRMPVAIFHKGLGMVVVPMTPAELLHLARNFAVKRGKIHKDGYYAVEFQAPSAAAALASVLHATAPAGAMFDAGRYGVRYGGPPSPDWV